MIAALVLRLVAAGIPQKVARPLIYLVGAILAVLLLWGAKTLYDRSIIRQHDAKQDAAVSRQVIDANENASTTRLSDQKRIDADEAAITNAVAPLPDAGLTARQRARACAVLLRQSTAAGRPVPAGC